MLTPTRLDSYSPTEMLIAWNDGPQYSVPYIDLRYECPCASCVDEHTGQRTILRSQVAPDVRPKEVKLVGRYAVQVTWSDRHSTGMYHFDTLRRLSEKYGRPL